MTRPVADFEGLVREALAPVEPPDTFGERLEGALTSLTESAAEELEAWELSSMRDPRNWVRPVIALLVGTVAGASLVLVRRARRRPPPSRIARGRAAAGQALRDAHQQARRLRG